MIETESAAVPAGSGDPFEGFVRCTAESAARRLSNTCRIAGIDTQDILQDTYTRAWSRCWPKPLADLSAPQQLAWVTTTASRLLIDRLRTSEHRLRQASETPNVDLPAAAHPDLPEQLQARERFLRACRCIQELRPLEQNVVVMYALLGYEYEEIANHLDISRDYIATIMSRARARLRNMIREEELA